MGSGCLSSAPHCQDGGPVFLLSGALVVPRECSEDWEMPAEGGTAQWQPCSRRALQLSEETAGAQPGRVACRQPQV